MLATTQVAGTTQTVDESPAAATTPTGPEAVEVRRALSPDEVQKSLRYIVEKDRLVLDDLPRRFLEAFAAILKHTNYRQVVDNYARVTARCANCAPACQIYQHTRDPRDVPCYRSNLLLEVYRRHFTLRGIIQTRLLGREYLTEDRVLEMASSYYDCTACRRCSLECPLGVDHGLVTHLARYVLSELGFVPRALSISVREQLEGPTRNTSAIPLPAILDTTEFLAGEIRDEKGREVSVPVDKEDRDYVFFPAVSDYLMEAETLMGIVLTLSACGDQDRWTIGSRYFDGINYGLFYNDWILERVLVEELAEARRLRARNILIGECGHASRTAKAFSRAFGGGDAPPVVHIIEYTYNAFKQGRLRLRAGTITERVTYHDPCNIARTGWVVDEPRELLRAFCSDVVEMTPRGALNLCCGGGGGTVSIDELRAYRTGVTGVKKAEQLKATGAKYVVAPCANCKKQLRELCEDHGLDMQVVGLHDLIYRAIELD
jgi:Fe-S oxidoreductase